MQVILFNNHVRLFARTSQHLWPGAIVAPYLGTAATDTRYCERLTRAIFRFQAVRSTERLGIHTVDERVHTVRFFFVVAPSSSPPLPSTLSFIVHTLLPFIQSLCASDIILSERRLLIHFSRDTQTAHLNTIEWLHALIQNADAFRG
jgi:hypothetical protein